MSSATVNAIIQGLTLLALAATVFYSARQAKASEEMARFSLQQTRVLQAQMHATFRPLVSVTSGRYDYGYAELDLKNCGTGPAIGVVAIYPNRVEENLGDMTAGQNRAFRFLNANNHYPQQIAFKPHPHTVVKAPADPNAKSITLRLEYQSMTGTRCWTKVYFAVGGSFAGTVTPENESGFDVPTLESELLV